MAHRYDSLAIFDQNFLSIILWQKTKQTPYEESRFNPIYYVRTGMAYMPDISARQGQFGEQFIFIKDVCLSYYTPYRN